MWAAGIVLFMLLVGTHPFQSLNSKALLFKEILNGENITEQQLSLHKGISDEAKDLIIKLIKKDPNLRLSAEDALEHTWFFPK